jgi:hypothetical protein
LKELIRSAFSVQDDRERFEAQYRLAGEIDQLILRAILYSRLEDTPGILASGGTDWWLCLLASHQRSTRETVRVFKAVIHAMHVRNPLPRLLHYTPAKVLETLPLEDLADFSLIGAGIFYGHVHHRFHRKAAPPLRWYVELGKLAFDKTGYHDVAEHFDGWSQFLNHNVHIDNGVWNSLLSQVGDSPEAQF